MHILVVGAGSIGQRHIKNLVELGVDQIDVYDPDVSKTLTMDGTITRVANIESSLCLNPNAAIVAVPTYLHSEVAHSILDRADIPLFIEKPVAHNLEAGQYLATQLSFFNQWAVIGYSLRFHPALTLIKDLLPQIGTPLYARAEVGQYLPDWHPNEDYRNWYMAKEELGGGALLDLSHEIDYMQYLFGSINDITDAGYVDGHKHSPLEVTSDVLAEFLCQLGDGVVGSIHMDLLDRSYNRRLRIVGTEGTISWDWNEGVVKYYSLTGDKYFEPRSSDWCTYKYGEPVSTFSYEYRTDRNIQFKEEMRAFINSVETGIVDERFCSLEDGIEVLKVVEELKRQNGRA